jgi:hypothetical protein
VRRRIAENSGAILAVIVGVACAPDGSLRHRRDIHSWRPGDARRQSARKNPLAEQAMND